jgi:hypothetical protein
VNIGRYCSADREPVGSRLLLTYAPRAVAAAGTAEVCTQDARPLDAGLDLQQAPLLVEATHSVHPAHIQEGPAAQELLSAHGVPPTGNRHGSPFGTRALDGSNHVVECARLERPRDASGIQSGVDVVIASRLRSCADSPVSGFHACIVAARSMHYNTERKGIVFQYHR